MAETETINHWSGFLRFVQEQNSSQWAYRGVSDAAYELVPSVGRRRYDREKERAVFRMFCQRAEIYRPLFGLNQFDRLALAQHHGLPTRLLDWTTSPLVAAYFASSGTKDTDMAIYRIRTRREDYIRPADGDDPLNHEALAFYLPRFVSPRISAQSGLFSIHGNPQEPLSDERVAKIVVSGRLRKSMHRKLFYLGISAASLMPDIDGLSATLRWQFDGSIGLWSSKD